MSLRNPNFFNVDRMFDYFDFSNWTWRNIKILKKFGLGSIKLIRFVSIYEFDSLQWAILFEIIFIFIIYINSVCISLNIWVKSFYFLILTKKMVYIFRNNNWNNKIILFKILIKWKTLRYRLIVLFHLCPKTNQKKTIICIFSLFTFIVLLILFFFTIPNKISLFLNILLLLVCNKRLVIY